MVKRKQEDPEKKNTSLRLAPKVLKELKMVALENETSVQAILEKLVKNFLKREQTKKKKGPMA